MGVGLAIIKRPLLIQDAASLPLMDRSVAHARLVLGQQVPGEVAAQVAPHGVDVIRAVLGVVVLDEQARTAERVIVAGAWLDRPGPPEAHLVESGVGDVGPGWLATAEAARSTY